MDISDIVDLGIALNNPYLIDRNHRLWRHAKRYLRAQVSDEFIFSRYKSLFDRMPHNEVFERIFGFLPLNNVCFDAVDNMFYFKISEPDFGKLRSKSNSLSKLTAKLCDDTDELAIPELKRRVAYVLESAEPGII